MSSLPLEVASCPADDGVMIASIILAGLAIALLPAWSHDDPSGGAVAALISRVHASIAEMNYAARRLRELQTEWPTEEPGVADTTPRAA